ncbi:hypothetical protein [Pseudomonas sp.]|uniref:hypothetical protein n=1 Tax=Pseudomonas sp. TaxID=306 RepID=UPI0029125D7A|nr:hypothetical protein [Pseudomonas sp.]MDU4254595.1 hypothetical protein [Pseudomonas sp.]
MDCSARPSAQQLALMASQAELLNKAAARILGRAPETTAIWCYGLNALEPENATHQWDFIAFVDAQCNTERLDQLNKLGGPLDSLPRCGNHHLDVQALLANDQSPCARLVRREGFCIWHKPAITLAA